MEEKPKGQRHTERDRERGGRVGELGRDTNGLSIKVNVLNSKAQTQGKRNEILSITEFVNLKS